MRMKSLAVKAVSWARGERSWQSFFSEEVVDYGWNSSLGGLDQIFRLGCAETFMNTKCSWS